MSTQLRNIPAFCATLVFLSVAPALQAQATNSAASVEAQDATTQTAPITPAPSAKTPSREGFWGHMNPFARKKWVNRQVQPLREREDELDVVTASNTRDIRDVDARSAAGIRRATDSAQAADAHAGTAESAARKAQQTADATSLQANSLQGTVNGLDNYTAASTSKVKFAPGATTLGPTGRRTLDTLAASLGSDKGYVLQVEGYSTARGTAGTAQSEKMADSVTRYLVAKHNIPLYRITRIGYGSARPAGVHVTGGSVVEVTLLHNSLAASNRPEMTGSTTGVAQ